MTTITPSRLLTRLDADIAAATDLVAADCLRAERAAYLARQGHLAEAKKELEAIRKRHSSIPTAAVSAWVSLAEGVVIHFTNLSPHALDKLNRSYAISAAVNLPETRRLSAAWLSHLHYLATNYEESAKYASIALSPGDSECPSAKFRAYMVVGLALHLVGKEGAAIARYELARREASEIGDSAAIGALMHNVAWLWAYNLRSPSANISPVLRSLRRASLTAESSFHFDAILGSTGLMSLQPLLRGFVATINGEFELSATSYELVLFSDEKPVLGTMGTVFATDYIWSLLNLRRHDEAEQILKQFDYENVNRQQADDRAMTQDRLAQILDLLGEHHSAAAFRANAQEAWLENARSRKRILEGLRRYELYEDGAEE